MDRKGVQTWMRIFPTRNCKSPALLSLVAPPGTPAPGKGVASGELPGRKPGGFSLIELLLVLMLMGMVMFLALPAFQNMLEGRLQQETNRMSGLIRLLRNEAVLERSNFRIQMDLDMGKYWPEVRSSTGDYGPKEGHSLLRPHEMPPAVRMEKLFMFGKEMRIEKEKPISIRIDASGFVDPFLLHLLDGENPYTLKVTGFTGKVSLVEGHVSE